MRSITTPQFKKLLADLPERTQDDARAGFQRWKDNPLSVGWKSLSGMHANVYSVEIGRRHRAIAVVSKEHNTAVWMFVGSHETYNNYVEARRQMTQKNWLATSMERLESGMTEALKQRREEKKGHPTPQKAPHPPQKRPGPG